MLLHVHTGNYFSKLLVPYFISLITNYKKNSKMNNIQISTQSNLVLKVKSQYTGAVINLMREALPSLYPTEH